jgi:hypothetical protein
LATVGGEVGATAVEGAQAARIRPDQASSSERRETRVIGALLTQGVNWVRD